MSGFSTRSSARFVGITTTSSL